MIPDEDAPVIELKPTPDVAYSCPRCKRSLTVDTWHMPGMRPLAMLTCASCGREFVGDLPSGNAVHAPTLLDRDSMEVFQPERESYWFGKWLRESYTDHMDKSVDISVKGMDTVDNPAVLNCLDALYGHALLKLLNAQRFVESTSADVVVITQPNFEWLVPDDVPAVITVNLPLCRGYEWNETLAAEFRTLFAAYDRVRLCCADPHPHPSTFDIHRYSGVYPHDIENGWRNPTKVTFVWRDDRCWSPLPPWAIVEDFLDERVPLNVKSNDFIGTVGSRIDSIARWIQKRRVLGLESVLREQIPTLDFAVAGIAESGGLPERITDLRLASPSDADERRLCERYAASSVVVGVHGSNMILPSAHAGAAVELVPERRWGNILQDLVVRNSDAYEAVYHTRLLSLGTSPESLAACIGSLIGDRDSFRSTLPESRYNQ